MSSSFPNNQLWGNKNNGPANNPRNDIPLGLHGGNNQQFGRPPYQTSWQQSPQQQQHQPPQQPQLHPQLHLPMAPQPIYPQPQQQTLWNNNATQKPTMNSPQPAYQADRSSLWTRSAPQQQYVQSPPQQQHHQALYSNNPPNPYSLESIPNMSGSSTVYNASPQQNYPANQYRGDDSTNSSTATPYWTNNNFQNDTVWDWNVDDSQEQQTSYNPVQNYFQPGNNQVLNKSNMQDVKLEQVQSLSNEVQNNSVSMVWQGHDTSVTQNSFENKEQVEKNLNIPKQEHVANETGNYPQALTVENLAEVSLQSGENVEAVYDGKSESVHSFQSGSLSNTSEFKTERLSPDSGKIPLTTQALREFHKEIYENGPVGLKSRHNNEGLTPQWSIESQMSQDTGSDDISPSIQGGSQSDVDTRPSTVSQSPLSNQHGDQSWCEYPETIQETESSLEDNLSNLRNSNVLSAYLPSENFDQGPVQSPNTTTSNQRFVNVRSDLYEENYFVSDISSNLESLSVSNQNSSAEDVENKEIVSPEQKSDRAAKLTPPPPPPVGRTGEGGVGGNPYSLNRKFANNKRQNNNVYQNPTVEDSLNQQVIPCDVQSQAPFKSDGWMPDESVNLETVPENKERPDAVEHKVVFQLDNPIGRFTPTNTGSSRIPPPRGHQAVGMGIENHEITPRCGPDRNQYLETGRLEDQIDQDLANSGLACENLPPPGLSRLVMGEGQYGNSNVESGTTDASTPPPGLDRMVLGQLTENESSSAPNVSLNHHNQSTPPPGLHRMVLGQLTDDPNQNSKEENQNMSSSNDIPPPGFHRMIPGESSSPETQNVIQPSREQRVVTGVAKDEIDVNVLQTIIPSASPTPANRLSSQTNSPEESRIQPQSERCETIGSDNVETYTNTVDNSGTKQSKRKEKQDRHREDISSDEREREPSRRRDRDQDYYQRDRNREDSPPGQRERFRDDRERKSKGRDRGDWDRDRRKESPGRYRDDKDRRRDYREDRRRHRDYDYSDDEDADTNGYYSDRDRHNMSGGYRDDYDRNYARRDDRARSLRPEKSPRERNDESNRSAGKDRRRGGYGDRDRERDRDRDPRHPDYYRRRGHDDVDDYRDGQRSRPSSRNGSVHDFKNRGLSGRNEYEGERDRDRDRYRDRDHHRGHSKRDRDMYYQHNYNYDPAYYSYYYQYYENLRRTNPAAYAEVYRKYYAQSQHGTFEGTYTEDRGSVHSGRSSANEETKDRFIKVEHGQSYGPPHLYPCYHPLVSDQPYPFQSHSSDTGDHEAGRRLDSSLQIEDSATSVQRLTPAKFTTAHVKGILTARGSLIKILAHYPLDGQPATVVIHDQLACLDDTRKELQEFPGPLVKGVTHKNNVLRYCRQKIKEADTNPSLFDKDSYKLIWELLILLIRQNGTVVGTDIAELLMSNRSANTSLTQPSPSPATSHHSINDIGNQPALSEEEVTNQFRDYLIYGNTKEALEWAMKHGLWGHALFLASKMDQRTYASVMTRFANGLTMNDPLQTLYQLMSGRQPASVTCCADEKWGDWRPHLAMVLSNSSSRPDLDVKAIATLGDTLGSRGSLHAAHFCYLMAQMEFGSYAQKSSKIVLIGSSHNQSFSKFSTNEAIFATEIFEFACTLADSEFVLHHLQVYKLLIARRLSEVGLAQEAVHYVEMIANTIGKHPSHYSPSFIQEVYDLGNVLKYFDPVYTSSETAEGCDPDWLSHLLNILSDYQMGVLQQNDGCGSVSNLTTYSENDGIQNLPLDGSVQDQSGDMQSWQGTQIPYEQPVQQHWQPNTSTTEDYSNVQQVPTQVASSGEEPGHQYWYNPNQAMPQDGNNYQATMSPVSGGEYNSGTTPETIDAPKPPASYNYYDSYKNEGAKPQISLPGSVSLPNSKPRTFSQSSETEKKKQPKPGRKEQPKSAQGNGWFGGLWNKLALRPKNQMILPDDKDPSIVWDSNKKRWVDLDGDEAEGGGALPPPPKASDLPPMAAAAAPAPAPIPGPPMPGPAMPLNNSSSVSDQIDSASAPSLPPPGGPNMYRMSRGKGPRSNYVDIMNPGGAKPSAPTVPPPDLFPSLSYQNQVPTNFLIPQSVEGNENASTDFLSPAPQENFDTNQPQGGMEDYNSGHWNGGPVLMNPRGVGSTLPRAKH